METAPASADRASNSRTQIGAQETNPVAASPEHARHQPTATRLNRTSRVSQLKAYAEKLNTGPRTAPVQRVAWGEVEHSRIEVETTAFGFTAWYDREKAGDLDLYEDDEERQWINNISVTAHFQGKGIGLSLLNAAKNQYGAVYAAVNMQPDDEVDGSDTRHLSMEGAALVNSALRNGILLQQWCFNPAWQSEGSEEQSDAGEAHSESDHIEDDMDHWIEPDDSEHEPEPDPELALDGDCSVTVVLDDANTGGNGFQYWAEVTNLENQATRTVEFNDIIMGEHAISRAALETALSEATGYVIQVTELNFDYAD